MKVNKALIDILNNYSVINTMCYFDGSNILKSRSIDNTIFAEVVVSEFINESFAFYDIGQITRLLNEGSDIKVKNNILHINNEDYEIKYRLSNIEKVKERVFNSYYFDEFDMNVVCELFLSSEQFKKILNISNKIDNDTAKITSIDNSKIRISTVKNGVDVANEFNIDIDVDHAHFEDVFTFSLDRFKFINARDYKIQIGYRINKSGVSIPLMKAIAIYNNDVNVKYIIVANR